MAKRQRPPISVAELRRRIAQVPRIPLALLPTPLEPMPRLSAHLGVRVIMKRDDLTGLGFGGNKTRNLEFRLAEAQALGATDVVARLDVQSNSARQTTAAANRLGMKTHLILVGEAAEWQGNLLVDALLGAEIQIAANEEAAEVMTRQVIAALEAEGRSVYSLNEGRMFTLGPCLAYALCMAEIHEQMAALGGGPDYVYLSSAGKGQAGVILGALALAMLCQPVGIACRKAPEAAQVAAETANQGAALLGLELTVRPEQVVNLDEFAAEEGKGPTQAGIEAVRMVAQMEGVLLDTVYTGKAMAGLIAHVGDGRVRRGSSVVFIHTGGAPVLFAHRDVLLARPGPAGVRD